MGLPPYGPEPYASANSATPAQLGFLSKRVNMIPQLIDHDKKKIHTGEIYSKLTSILHSKPLMRRKFLHRPRLGALAEPRTRQTSPYTPRRSSQQLRPASMRTEAE